MLPHQMTFNSNFNRCMNRSNGAIIRKERIQYCEIKAITNVTRLTIIKTSWFGLKKTYPFWNAHLHSKLQCTSDLI